MRRRFNSVASCHRFRLLLGHRLATTVLWPISFSDTKADFICTGLNSRKFKWRGLRFYFESQSWFMSWCSCRFRNSRRFRWNHGRRCFDWSILFRLIRLSLNLAWKLGLLCLVWTSYLHRCFARHFIRSLNKLHGNICFRLRDSSQKLLFALVFADFLCWGLNWHKRKRGLPGTWVLGHRVKQVEVSFSKWGMFLLSVQVLMSDLLFLVYILLSTLKNQCWILIADWYHKWKRVYFL